MMRPTGSHRELVMPKEDSSLCQWRRLTNLLIKVKNGHWPKRW